MPDIEFPVKTIRWSQYEQVTPILLQEENGPCPLIALVNTLLLSGDIEARTRDLDDTPKEGCSSSGTLSTEKLRALLKNNTGGRVLLAELLACLGDLLLELTHVDLQVVNNLLENLPLLHTGLDVNPNLVTGEFPSEDLASQIFGVFLLNFVHGWCWEPQNGEADLVFLNLGTFASIQEYLLGNSDDSTKMEVRSWLDDNSTQLTGYGLQKLDLNMKPDLVAIFFRNNHFSTLYKGVNHDFYLLITDTAFVRSTKYVWQSLISASGSEDLYFSGDFDPVVDGDDYHVEAEDDDMRLLQKLQEEEDSEMARRMQANFDKKRSVDAVKKSRKTKDGQRNTTESTQLGKTGDQDESKKKKKDACTIV